ncbi:hypothetical protein [Amycolatopsis pigmentata]|uniref:EcsC protein family protein n=1 Tax=Amycolatopsis pigmentata TaxID=450801 RepID=A0ABW5G0H7_9PSEU
MAEAISDRQIVAALRPFVRAAGPVVAAMRTPGRLRRFAALKVPGSVAWRGLSAQARTMWWINRVGRLTALVTAIPGLGGALADRLPVQDALGASAQGLLLCAIAEEHGVHDVADRVRLLAWVLFKREVDPALAAGKQDDPSTAAESKNAEDAEVAKLTGDFGRQMKRRITIAACAAALWRLARLLMAISGELEKRPRGHFYQRFVGALPVIGMLGDYLAERSALRHSARATAKWLSNQGISASRT